MKRRGVIISVAKFNLRKEAHRLHVKFSDMKKTRQSRETSHMYEEQHGASMSSSTYIYGQDDVRTIVDFSIFYDEKKGDGKNEGML